MRAWLMPVGCDSFEKLYLGDLPDPTPGPGEVVIAPKAWSINYRDFAVAMGKYFGGAITEPSVPLSDGAGEVIAVGEGVTECEGGRQGPVHLLPGLDRRPAAVRPRAG